MPRAIRKKKRMLHRLKHKPEKEGRMRNRTPLGAGLVSGEEKSTQSNHLKIKASKTKTQASIKPCIVSTTAHSSHHTDLTESGRLSCTSSVYSTGFFHYFSFKLKGEGGLETTRVKSGRVKSP